MDEVGEIGYGSVFFVCVVDGYVRVVGRWVDCICRGKVKWSIVGRGEFVV